MGQSYIATPNLCHDSAHLLHHPLLNHCIGDSCSTLLSDLRYPDGPANQLRKTVVPVNLYKRTKQKGKRKQIPFQSVHQWQPYEWISDVGHTMKDLDEKQSRSAQKIDTRGWPACVVSYWCINYIQESCPNTSHTICRFSSQRERAELRLIIGLSPSVSEIQAKTFNVGGLGTQL